ncbi:hypothetical protein CC1G_06372 [Coprinopsis cinerea okayama7|uniref:Receptor-activated Ca2+-permeable cation channel n=1 Tax=Coprinopsis cinerea (strain Okayama-7 / 130 / ATCC MYA-4618 / FGSC 9003) TaxID=240176 RepID=A8NTR6_COPC7|nr:hypothetical protein CC1G_06372 [Coprinopsis cinerea okayama7\|eukprot:XP_001836287.1 hypothetical protein CC1G_06372 [Coprinopsis cinerea okayama7\
MDPEQQTTPLLAPTAENLAKVKVFPLIPALRKDVTKTIDSALSWEQLTAADINFSIVRPLVNKYARLRNISVVYACLVVRQYFLTESEAELAYAGVMVSRASLCEILAIKLLGRFATHYIQLVAVLTTSWNPLAGASQQVVEEVKMNMGSKDNDIGPAVHSAIEMAIATEAKDFLASTVTQKVVNDIYAGRVVFTVAANRSLLADNYKSRAIEIYDPKRSSWLDHYRLRVPQYGNYLEFINFAILLVMFMLCLSNQDKSQVTPYELVFIVFAAAFTLEEYTASTGHGWIIYIANIWNAFDFTFILIFLAYVVLRIQGLSNGNCTLLILSSYVPPYKTICAAVETSAMAFDVLACGACILFPRLAFFFVSDNLVILSLRAMIVQFAFFITIAAICFSGLLFTLWTLAADNPEGKDWSAASIAWLMVQIWFGNTSLSFDQASSFHPLWGPILMTAFAALSNTLLLTILISILSNTVARIDANATKECLFQYTISTVEGVKSDALFSYQPPFNLLAFLLLKPSSFFLTPRQLHTFNVFLIRVTSLPQLIVIALYERYLASGFYTSSGAPSIGKLREAFKDVAQGFYNSLPRHLRHMPLVEAVVGSVESELWEAIFEVCEDDEVVGDLWSSEEEDEDGPALKSVHSRETMKSKSSVNKEERSGGQSRKSRRGSRSTRRDATPSRSPVRDGNGGAGLKKRPSSIRMDLTEASPILEISDDENPDQATQSIPLAPSPDPMSHPPSATMYAFPSGSSAQLSTSGAHGTNYPYAHSNGGGQGHGNGLGGLGSGGSPRRQPRQRLWSVLSPLDVSSPEVVTKETTRSPLARLYSGRGASPIRGTPSYGALTAGVPGYPPPQHHMHGYGRGGYDGRHGGGYNDHNIFGYSSGQGSTSAGYGGLQYPHTAPVFREAQMHMETSVKKLEGLMEDAKSLPVNKLKEEMKELQDRQARIENLLLMLTRGMRNETGKGSL